MNAPTTVLVLGGTGFVGPHVVTAAVERGHRVTVFDRGTRRERVPDGVEVIVGTASWDGWMRCAVGSSTWSWTSPRCARHGSPTSPRRWVSWGGTCSSPPSRCTTWPVRTRGPRRPRGWCTPGDAAAVTEEEFRANVAELYGPLKAAAEDAAVACFGDRATIVRPGLIVAARRPHLPVHLLGRSPGPRWRGARPGDGDDPVQVIDVRDLASWLVRLGESDRGGAFNAVGPPTTTTMGDLLDAVMAGVGDLVDAPARLTWVPAEFLETHDVAPWAHCRLAAAS